MTSQDRLNIAVFIDFDNIEIGVKNTLGQQFDVGGILDAIKERGEVVTKIAYADWTRAGEYSRALTQHAIRLVQRNLTPGGDKNGADINLALDALEMAFTHPHINAYVIVGGDSDFLSLVEKLKQYDKKVFVVGGRAFTSTILQRNCHEFIAYENLAGVRRGGVRGGRPISPPASIPVAHAFPIVRRALKILAEREVSPQTGLLKSTLLQLDSTFSERNYGASSFFDFVEKLSQAGLVSLKHAGRSLMVELNEGFGAPEGTVPENGVLAAPAPASAEPAVSPTEIAAVSSTESAVLPTESAAVLPTESAEAGIERAGRILGAATNARWPMYLRNVRQILRQAEGGFDERRYGFGGLMDLLKACQRAGLVRIERDHRGGLRVFYGPALRLAGQSRGSALPPAEPVAAPRDESIPEEQMEDSLGNTAVVAPAPPPATADDSVETEESSPETIPIDTTANRLGLTSHRRPRGWASRQASTVATVTPTRPASTKSAPKKKPAARKSTRSKKAPKSD